MTDQGRRDEGIPSQGSVSKSPPMAVSIMLCEYAGAAKGVTVRCKILMLCC